MALHTPISPAKKTYTAAVWAVEKVKITHAYAIQKMGGVNAVAGAILLAAKAWVYNTVGKAMDWLEQRLATGIPIVIGFLASQIGSSEKFTLRAILEKLT